jgi:hypothetical protein
MEDAGIPREFPVDSDRHGISSFSFFEKAIVMPLLLKSSIKY